MAKRNSRKPGTGTRAGGADHHARRARTEGYRARSVYKLQEIQRKFAPIKAGSPVLELGAAPGSWTQYVVEIVGASVGDVRAGNARVGDTPGTPSRVIAVDLQEMSVPGAVCIPGDFTAADTAARIETEAPFGLILSDAAPATTGNRVVDTGRSEALVETILAHLPRWLAPEGNLVCKVFQGGGEQRFLRQVRKQFGKGHLYRPEAVRKESFETYLVGLKYLGGDEID